MPNSHPLSAAYQHRLHHRNCEGRRYRILLLAARRIVVQGDRECGYVLRAARIWTTVANQAQSRHRAWGNLSPRALPTGDMKAAAAWRTLQAASRAAPTVPE